MATSRLAILGGKKAIPKEPEKLFRWPIVTKEDERAVLAVLREGKMSELDVTQQLEKEFAGWNQVQYALGHNTGTAAIQAAMFGCKIGEGDEVICPSITYWASALPALSLGARVVFADIDADTLCIDPNDIEHRITDRTKAIVVVHLYGHPADMDPILKIARKRNLKVIEDISHAQGGLYKGKKLGTFGDVSGISLMSGKAFPCGEGGILITNDREIYDRAVAWGHYERFQSPMQTDSLNQFIGLPMGGYKYRMHQLSSAMARVQLRHYDARSREIRKAMNLFWDHLEGVPGIRPHRVDEASGSTMGGWYYPIGRYRPEELGGLSSSCFCEAVRAEGIGHCTAWMNTPLHTHALFHTRNVYKDGIPAPVATVGDGDRSGGDKCLPVSEKIGTQCFTVPWFKHCEPKVIEHYADAFRKVAESSAELLKIDRGNPPEMRMWSSYHAKK